VMNCGSSGQCSACPTPTGCVSSYACDGTSCNPNYKASGTMCAPARPMMCVTASYCDGSSAACPLQHSFCSVGTTCCLGSCLPQCV
jgi:hypothetical protein